MRLAAQVPTRLPLGRTELTRWGTSVIFMANVPDNRSTRFALSGMILQGSGTKGYKPKWFFVSQLIKFCANEVARVTAEEFHNQKMAEHEAEKKAALTVVSNASPTKS